MVDMVAKLEKMEAETGYDEVGTDEIFRRLLAHEAPVDEHHPHALAMYLLRVQRGEAGPPFGDGEGT